MSEQNIQLNFLEITPQKFSFTVFRKDYSKAEINNYIYKYRLPKIAGDQNYENYCVSFEPLENYETFLCDSHINPDLTLKIIHNKLIKSISEIGIEFSLGKKFFDRHIDFTLRTHSRGKEKISLNSYFLKQEKKFGFLIDFFFKANEEEKGVDRELLKLSLALGKDGRSNRNYYSDHFHKIQSFIKSAFKRINNFRIDETELKISENLIQIQSALLSKKVFRFKNEQTDTNQFNGMRKFGAYQEISEKIKYVFIFEEKYRSFANNLFFSLIGKSNPGTFSGMEQFFNLPFGNQFVHKIPLISYKKNDVLKAINEVIDYRNSHSDHKVIAIFLEPNRFDGIPPNESPYYNFKFHLTKENIPVQVVRDDVTNNANALKWSTSNIALQIFSKLGGTPWLLKHSQNECLILGIGSALERRDNEIIKYFAYSVCVDSSGRYKKLDILAEESTKEEYLKKLSISLVELLRTPEFSKYKKCALHISESVTREAIRQIQKALTEIHDVEFKVLKINSHNKFFGYSNHNTYVPYESTYIKLDSNEYLIWFDGLVKGRENIYQKVGNPIHIKFLHSENVTTKNDLEYLQDAINLSGANWRGFNARQTPISIYYAKIVADYTAAFSHFEDFDKTHLSNNLPWFL